MPEDSFQESRPVERSVTPLKQYGSAGILTCCPSTTLFSLVLGPTNPGRIYLPQETLGLRRAGFSPALSLLIPAFSLACAPTLLTVRLQRGMQRSSTDPDCSGSRCFGIQLIPDHLRRYSARPVSYYALFKWWLLLSQHPGCLSRITS